MTRILDGKVAFVTGGGSGIGEAGSKKTFTISVGFYTGINERLAKSS